jgi:regulator of sirC expression with transglutaminase-like and TPR domain
VRGLRVEGVNFPGHFLLRMPTVPIRPAVSGEELVIVDPFHEDALLDLDDCELLFHQHVGDGELDGRAFEPAARSQIVVRTLANLKRLYVRMRSFRPARLVSELLLAIEPARSPSFATAACSRITSTTSLPRFAISSRTFA